MSLLLKALQNAAKNREAGTTGTDTTAPPEPRNDTENGLSLEPIEPTERPAAAPRPQAPASGPAAGAAGSGRIPAASPAQAQTVLRASARPAPPPASSPGVLDWLARRPLVAFSTAAGLFAIGYGIYLYLQITNPGIFMASPVTPPPGPVASPPPQAPVPPAPMASVPAELPLPQLAPEPPAVAAMPDAPPSLLATAPPAAGAPAEPRTPAAPTPTPMPSKAAPAEVAPAPARSVIAPPAGATGASSATAAAPAPRTQPPTATGSVVPPSGSLAIVALKVNATPPKAPPRTTASRTPAETSPSTAQVVPVSSDLLAAYQALEKGQLNDAERLYRQVLTAEPRSIDGMLGLASVLAQQNRGDAATQLYLRILDQEPRNAYAQAGLLNISGRADPTAAESRLKQLIAREPSAFLYFSLGNLYSEQGQWAAAQSAYFQAVSMAPDNPDYAFNLAVGLEHLSQQKLALDYYRRAVSIAQARGNAQFALAPVQARIRSLEAALSERP
jgi:Tfp pilus assembly protein PilF